MPDTTDVHITDVPLPRKAAYTVTEAAQLLGIGRTTAYALIESGDLGSFRIGRSRRIPPAAIEQFVTARMEADAVAQPA